MPMMHPATMPEGILLESFALTPQVAGEPVYEGLRAEIRRRERSALLVGLSAIAIFGGLIGGISLL